ncbi:TetR/AcrR family transcriptional regulator [Saccharopolyspora sp. NFXS83]|uniref:TetR/AcrR family transcriptional regulator n=1 Tax=Saccharopolyspora sp. NFXS83 TaxID=2993560 RepID=UPI00224A954F|nr:TetR/AcrR family transcriptional regulator [Saccharopolyspora sp. NFXS83]MCX2730049.1 TetR/AcrR family transcriptional regulator [Saccharopolyspora sp. NFXS83]
MRADQPACDPTCTERAAHVERADAARNRRRIMDAAQGMVRRHGVESLSMEDVAQSAGVGVGTVYRRFGDRAGLAYALLDEREREFQEAFLSGPAPLGPGAAPGERIRAFLDALLDRVDEQSALLLVAETNSAHARHLSGAYGAHRAHLAELLRSARPEGDAQVWADALLAPFGSVLITYQQEVAGMPLERIRAGLDDLVTALLR